MMRSLYSAVTGLRNHQTSMDVIGNNIANVNTIGYKRSKATFATLLSQTLSGASAPDSRNDPPTFGGTNPLQVGLGMAIASIDRLMNQGVSMNTGSTTDLMIQDAGFFTLQLGQDVFYSRAGHFGFDKDGNLVEPATGALVLGYANSAWQGTGASTSYTPDWSDGPGIINIQLDMKHKDLTDYTLRDFMIDQRGVVTGVFSNGDDSITEQLYCIALTTFNNPGGLMSVGNNFYTPSNNSGRANTGFPGEAGRGVILPGNLEMSNVELAQEFTDMIVTQRGFQANARVITVSDTLLEELINLKR